MDSVELTIPDPVRDHVARFRDGLGLAWLHELPAIVAECRQRWSVTLESPYTYPSLSYVAPGVHSDGSPAVLKVGFLHDELADEIAALRAYDGHGAARLLEADPVLGALLLERLQPGDCLATLTDDEEATAIAASVMRELWRPAPSGHPFPRLEDWTRGLANLRERFGGGTGPLPAGPVAEAESLLADLQASAPEPMLLHGDLQHFNVLRADRRPWLAIDPKGIVGDPGFEVGAYLGNCWEDHPNPARLMTRRLDQFAAELGIERARLRAWSLVQAVLSAWWGIEDDGDCSGEAIKRIELAAEVP